MPFPKTIDELRGAGYSFVDHRECKGPNCSTTIEFWKTPKGKYMPFDVDAKGNVKPHWASCVDRGDF